TLPMQRILLPAFAILIAAAFMLPAKGAGEKKKDDGYVAIFDGKSLDGWHVSAKSGHSRKSNNQSGGKWVVADGAITGTKTSRATAVSSSPTKNTKTSRSSSK